MRFAVRDFSSWESLRKWYARVVLVYIVFLGLYALSVQMRDGEPNVRLFGGLFLLLLNVEGLLLFLEAFYVKKASLWMAGVIHSRDLRIGAAIILLVLSLISLSFFLGNQPLLYAALGLLCLSGIVGLTINRGK